MIDESNRKEVLKELDLAVLSYKIQIFSLNVLIEIAENLDKIEIPVEEGKQDDILGEIENKTVKKQRNEKIKLEVTNNKRLHAIRHPFIDAKELIEGIFKYLAIEFLKIASRKVLLRSLLIYSISIWEGFMRDYLRIILTHNWEVLKNIKKEKKYPLSEIIEMLSEFDSIDEFRIQVVEDYLFDLLYDSIDNISKKLRSLGIIDLDDFRDWYVLKNAYYARNVITHNNGVINKKYCRDTGLSECKIGEEIEITSKYLRDISNTIDNFIDFFHTKICEKYRLDECLDNTNEKS